MNASRKTKIWHASILCVTVSFFLAGCDKKADDFVKALQSRQWGLAQKMLDNEPDLINIRFDKARSYSLLHVAVYEDDREMVEFLIKNGADIHVGTKDTNETPLHLAASQGHLKMAKILLNNGAEVNCRDNSLKTPLHKACLYTSAIMEMVDLLLSYGAEVDARAESGESPLCFACQWLKEDEEGLGILRLLLSNGADPNIECYYDPPSISLMQATMAGWFFKKAQLLEDHGAVLELMTDEGLQPFTVKEAQQLYQQNEDYLKSIDARDRTLQRQ